MSRITTDEVRRLAALARLELSPDEVNKFRDDIEAILGLLNELAKIDVDKYQPTDQVTGLVNVTRPDRLQSLPSPDKLLQASSETTDDQFIVKRVLT